MSRGSWFRVGDPVHAAEEEGLQFLAGTLPEDAMLFSNVELPTGRRGQTFEHDAIVVTPHAVFTIELKSWSGRVQGNRDRWTLADGTTVVSPLPLVTQKARVLKGLLERRDIRLARVWVQGLVLLTSPDAAPALTEGWSDLVHTRATLGRALTDPTLWPTRGAMDAATQHAITRVLADNRQPQHRDRLGDWRLIQRLDADDAPYDAWLAEAALTGERRVLHAHPVDADDEPTRQRHRERALREATLHAKLRGGRDILGYDGYFRVDDDPRSITLMFEDTTPFVSLPTWIAERNPSLTARLRLGARVARALQWVHDRGVVHRRLAADAVLVSPSDDAQTLRLCAFELAHEVGGRAPTLASTAGSLRYCAPEVVLQGEATAWSDRFALGATLVEILLGRPLFASVEALLRPAALPPLAVGDQPVPSMVADTLQRLLSHDPQARPAPSEVADLIEQHLDRPARRGPPDLEPGVVLRDTYRLVGMLGRGATATTWRVEHVHTGQARVLKIAEAVHADALRREAQALGEVNHNNLVRYYDLQADGDARLLLILEDIDGRPPGAADLPAARDVAAFGLAAQGLFAALTALHDRGWLHRDVKPDNVLIRVADGQTALLDLGLACREDELRASELAVGTPRYKDPLVYAEERWTPANDVYAAFLTLWELLTGLHPFVQGHAQGSPDRDRAPALTADDLPDAIDAATRRRLVALFLDALSPTRGARPTDARAASRALEDALRASAASEAPTSPGADAAAHLAPGDDADAPIDGLPVSTRAASALARLRVRRVGELAGLSAAVLEALPNVGRKTRDELLRWAAAVRARWPDRQVTPVVRPTVRPFYPALRDDPRPIEALAGALPAAALDALRALGAGTIGALSALPAAALTEHRALRAADVDAIRRALSALDGSDTPPSTLDDLADAVRLAVGAAPYAALERALGLRDGVARDLGTRDEEGLADAAIVALRAPHGPGATLLAASRDLMPAVGFTPITSLARALTAPFPTTPGATLGHAHPLGWARLAALLLREGARAAEAPALTLALRPPWTEPHVDAARAALAAAAQWPPCPRQQAEATVWTALPDAVQAALRGLDAGPQPVLDALLELGDGPRATAGGALYTPPVPLAAAISALRGSLSTHGTAAEIAVEVERLLPGVTRPDDLGRAMREAGWRREGDRWVDPARVVDVEAPAATHLDAQIPRQRVGAEVPPVVALLQASLAQGGVRVVAMPPARQHALSRRLHGWLVDALGEARVRFVDVDRVVVDALHATPLWSLVTHVERAPDPQDWRWLHAEAGAALDAAVADARPGTVTVLARPALLGTLGLLPWLSGFYERARGGRHGLVVLAVPGGIHDQRVQLNGRHPFPYTPDMAGIFLEEGA